MGTQRVYQRRVPKEVETDFFCISLRGNTDPHRCCAQDVKPSSTIFVVNFDVQRVRERDLERHFEYYGRIKRIEIKKNFAFVQVLAKALWHSTPLI